MARDPKYTYNPCDDCKYNFSYNNQECPICKMCEFKHFLAEYHAQKSEVERLERILNSYALQYGTVRDQQKLITEAKADVAREIFEEIESLMYNRFSNIMLGEDIRLGIAELKKKYMEVPTDEV